jgi:hypothetical protein
MRSVKKNCKPFQIPPPVAKFEFNFPLVARCQDVNRDFKQMSMYTGKTNMVDPEYGIAAKENFLPRGTEHGFSLKQ